LPWINSAVELDETDVAPDVARRDADPALNPALDERQGRARGSHRSLNDEPVPRTVTPAPVDDGDAHVDRGPKARL
jgi:hypothetical protein